MNAPQIQDGVPQVLVTDERALRTTGCFNRAAIRRHALKVSDEARAGKFTRVSDDFLNQREADAEAFFRSLRRDLPNAPLGQVEPDEDEEFLTGEGKKKLCESFRIWMARDIHGAVHKTRIGKTL